MVDYNKLAEKYSRHRQLNPEVLKVILSNGGIGCRHKILEIGCGTGNYIVAIQETTNCSCLGIDPSEQMLSEGKTKSKKITFKQGTAERLDFSNDFFDLVFSVNVIHFLEDRKKYLNEAYRVLNPGGKICTVTESKKLIRNRQPLAIYFPETIEVDLARYSDINELREIMMHAGFNEITEYTVEFTYQLTNIQPYRDKVFSTLHLISETAFLKGIERMERDIRKGPIPWVSRLLLLWGTK